VRWCILERTRESACEPALYCVVMHCSACFRDRRNTRALHLSRCQASQAMSPYPILFATAPSSCRPECTSCTISPHPPPTINSTGNYTRYTHASVFFIVLYPSCTHTHHIPTHLRLSFGLHDVECLHAFITHSLWFQKIPSCRYTKNSTPHTFMTCIMDHSHIDLDFQRSFL